jgi:DMSO reductase iron-sulfur subunit
MKSTAFILNLGKCVGCGACVLACRFENHWPEGVFWRRLLPLNSARYSGGPTYHFSLACHHCDEPACLKACPTGAYRKREDGVVLLEGDLCIGCRYCEMACPFGAPSYDADSGLMTKCNLCAQRMDGGLAPACVSACPTQALSIRQYAGGAAEDFKEQVLPELPGFSDLGACNPNIRFIAPGGRIRSRRFFALREELRQ